jgi:hypothetical protein
VADPGTRNNPIPTGNTSLVHIIMLNNITEKEEENVYMLDWL